AAVEREAPVAVLLAAQERDGALHRAGAAPAGGGERLHRTARVVDAARAAAAREVEAAVAVLLAGEPVRGAPHGCRGRGVAPGAEREHRERGPVDLLAERAVEPLAAAQRADEVAAAEAPRIEPGRPDDENRAFELAGVVEARQAGADGIDRTMASASHVEWIAPG